MNAPQLPLDQELAAAVAIVRVGLDRIRDAACRTEAVGPHAAALQALYDPAKPDAGVLAFVADVIGTITVSVTEVDHDDIERVTELLDEAQGRVQDSAGGRIRHALALLEPLLQRCEECGQQKPDVEVMADPFSTALYPEETDHRQIPLCPPCATKRFEES
ncbi:hypothetical protein SLUN_38815 (plasmid) [Streptomyces lunaelactis]|uniref:Uncharacterized protein n=1 Tax=Streptomyces lunaelactis TaxID=1535768 RepID=A0A2R4TFV3_9ACTN|nr:hypothetical protein [Streptomyces lunaelactis]AVZ77983.1 hypothetical protein SLUN_38815 [Streptomyces lunaelactis]NUK84942.1 hypothetical protein [Streptomyces lunaelactis]